MDFTYFFGHNQPDKELKTPKGQAIAGHAIGILVINIWYPLVPGNVANACTYNFPVLYKVLKEASIEQILSGDPALQDLVIKGGEELIQQGARAIVGACGSFANYQKETAAALEVPTFLSVMMQVPLILQSLKPDQKLGILCASKAALTQKVFDQCDIKDPSRLVITEALNLPEFQKMGNCTGQFNSGKLEIEIVDLVKKLIHDHPEIGALLIQCSDLPPYAWAIQDAIKLPVFDMNTLIEWVHHATVRRPYIGII
jgi:hypothetical protein